MIVLLLLSIAVFAIDLSKALLINRKVGLAVSTVGVCDVHATGPDGPAKFRWSN